MLLFSFFCMLYRKGGGVTHRRPRQKWQASWAWSQTEHRGVCWFATHLWLGSLSAALQKSQNDPVRRPQSTQLLFLSSSSSSAVSAYANTCMVVESAWGSRHP